MKELPLNEIFVYSKANKFCLDMFPPTNHQIRNRFENYDEYFGNADGIEPEAMSVMYSVYDGMGLYINLFDAFEAFRARFDDEDYDETADDKMDVDEESDLKQKKEMITDDENESDGNSRKMSRREKQNQIEFRMSIDDLRFCGFVKATNRKKETLMKTADLL